MHTHTLNVIILYHSILRLMVLYMGQLDRGWFLVTSRTESWPPHVSRWGVDHTCWSWLVKKVPDFSSFLSPHPFSLVTSSAAGQYSSANAEDMRAHTHTRTRKHAHMCVYIHMRIYTYTLPAKQTEQWHITILVGFYFCILLGFAIYMCRIIYIYIKYILSPFNVPPSLQVGL